MFAGMSELQIDRDPTDSDVEEIRQSLVAYNIARSGYNERFKAAVLVRNDDGSLAGGVYAYGWGGCFEVELLWVSEDRRGEGIGTRLMSAVEEEARRLGFSKIVLDTFSFQAPEFYRRLGFEQVAMIDDFPEGHGYFVFVKHLS